MIKSLAGFLVPLISAIKSFNLVSSTTIATIVVDTEIMYARPLISTCLQCALSNPRVDYFYYTCSYYHRTGSAYVVT